jgi:hypothetical protein
MAFSLVWIVMEEFFGLSHGYLHYQVKLFVNLCKIQSNINSRSWEKKCNCEAKLMQSTTQNSGSPYSNIVKV